jgi:hypothetical protein
VIATPSRQGDHGRRIVVRLAVICVVVLPGLFLWLAARLAGGRPAPDIWSWPARALLAEVQHEPFAPWTWVGAPHVASPALFYIVCAFTVLLLGGVALGFYTMVAGGIAAWFPGLLQRSDSPRPMGRRELGRLAVRGPQPGRMIIGHSAGLVATEPGSPLLVFGARGSGKTPAYCIPIIQEWSGPVVAASPKADLVDATAGIRQRVGAVVICDQSGATGLDACIWSPEAGCADFGAAIRRAGWMHAGASRDEAAEDDAIRAILAFSLWAAAHRAATLEDLCAQLRDEGGGRLQEVADRVTVWDPRVAQALGALAGLTPTAREECCGAVAEVLQATVEEVAAGGPASGILDPHELLPEGDGTLYLVMPGAAADRPSPLACSVLGAVLDEAFRCAVATPGDALDRRLLIVLDGFVPGTLLGELAQYVALAGVVNVTLLVTFLGRGGDWYGTVADDLLGGARAMVFLGGEQDEEALRLAADMVRCRGGTPERPPHLELAGLLGPGQAILLYADLPPVALWTRAGLESRRLAVQ